VPVTVAGEATGTGDVPRSFGTGDPSGVIRGLAEGESALIREGRAASAGRVREGAAADAEVRTGSGGDVSSVTGIGTGGGAGSSNAPHGSSSSPVPPQPIPTALGPADSAGALSNSSADVRVSKVILEETEIRAPVVRVIINVHQVAAPARLFC
jgi:hypothetical protein